MPSPSSSSRSPLYLLEISRIISPAIIVPLGTVTICALWRLSSIRRHERGKLWVVEQAIPLTLVAFLPSLPKSLPLISHVSESLSVAWGALPATRMKMDAKISVRVFRKLLQTKQVDTLNAFRLGSLI